MMSRGRGHRVGIAPKRAGRSKIASPAALAFGIVALGIAAHPSHATDRPDYDGFRQGTYLSYLNAAEDGAEMTRSPRLGLSFGGEVRPVLMDTGSTGIVVSASRIPGFDSMPSRPGRLTYSSSGRIMIGRWVTLPVTLVGRNEASVTTAPIPVLAVTRIDCTDTARACTPETMPEHVAMMGVGFGREGDAQSQSTPDTNPLLNLAPEGRGPARRGYVVTRAGIHVGLTGANTRGDIRFVKLDPHPDIPGEWQGVPVCITVNGQAPGACGRALVDTGVSVMYLTLPGEAVNGAVAVDDDGRSQFLPGTRLGFAFPGRGAAPAAAYDIVVGDTSPLSPDKVTLNTRRPEPFVNTGLRFLNGFDVLYDADGGYFGFRRR
ncbi:hypothetical protein [Methylobacterium sp. 10]|uniref:hypothetical protein n=1 Tax=Methylobacterium sp. 10 TaxID=1101191 RepID=UPI000489F040|nr:hypothetical protein [Methylobacterium sp. 10]